MGRKADIVDYRVEVEVEGPPSLNFEVETSHKKVVAEGAAESIERHVDNVLHVRVVPEINAYCSYCGYRWGEDEDSPHNGGCCDEDAKNIPEEDQ